MDVNEQFIQYGISPSSLNLVSKKSAKYLKNITADFEEPSNDQDKAVQIMLDENFFNALFAQLANVDKMYSLREFASQDPRLKIVMQLLTTTTISFALPAFKEEYGEGKLVDLSCNNVP